MGKMQRNKGANGERELFKLLSDRLNVSLSRNLQQTRQGGCDSLDLAPFAIEVKRQESLSLGMWWKQAVEQARSLDRIPVLAYRQSRHPWRFVVPIGVISGCDRPYELVWCITCEIDVFCEVVRDHLPLSQEVA